MNDGVGEAHNKIGLCASCRFKKEMKSDRGSVFYLCQLSATDPNFPKYPRLPVLQCAGYKPLADHHRSSEK